MRNFLFCLAVTALSMTAFAKTSKTKNARPKTQLEKNAEIVNTIKKGEQITVDKFDPHTDTFVITINAEPGIGPNFADAAALKTAIGFEGDMEGFMKQKNQMIKSIYQLKKDLVLLSVKQVVDRIHHAK